MGSPAFQVADSTILNLDPSSLPDLSEEEVFQLHVLSFRASGFGVQGQGQGLFRGLGFRV